MQIGRYGIRRVEKKSHQKKACYCKCEMGRGRMHMPNQREHKERSRRVRKVEPNEETTTENLAIKCPVVCGGKWKVPTYLSTWYWNWFYVSLFTGVGSLPPAGARAST